MGRRVAFTVGIFLLATSVARAQTLSVNGATAPAGVSVSAGAAVAVTVSNGPGNTTDWVALYPVGAIDGAYVEWRYLNGSMTPPATGLTDASLTLYAPITAGSYELRFFANNGYARLATSGIVTVEASSALLFVNGVPAPTSVSVVVGTSITVEMSSGPGNPNDWIALYPVAGASTEHIDWRYLNNATVAPTVGLTNAIVTVIAPVTPGEYEFRFLAHDGYGQLAASGVVMVSPSPAQLTIDGIAPPATVAVSAGTHVTVGMTSGPANPGDWVGLYSANTADGAPITWRYLNGTTTLPASGTSTATLNFAVPTAAGGYEFRFFAANSFSRLATSTTMVVSSPTAQLSVNGVAPPDSVTVPAGSIAVVAVSGGPANAGDWVALYLDGASNGAYIDWRYLNDTAVAPASGVATATLHFTTPTTAGTYEFRFFADDGYGLLTTSGAVVVPPSPAQIAVESVLPPTSVTTQPGATITVQVNNSPGNPTDWVALAETSVPNGAHVAWQYLNGSTTAPMQGQAGATLTFVMPASPGTYEVRLFANNGLNRVATSSSVVSSTTPPVVSVTLTTPFPGTTFVAPESLALEASATVTNGSITRVEFFANSALLEPPRRRPIRQRGARRHPVLTSSRPWPRTAPAQ